jgi:hypothetical protein
MVAAIGSRTTQVGSTQPIEQFNPKQEMQIAQATISGKGDAIPFLPQAAAEALPYTAGIKVFVGGRNYQSDNPLTIIKQVLKDNITLPSFSLPSFSLPKPAAPATQESSAVADRIAQLERELAGKVESGASNNTPQAQEKIADIKRKLAELKRPKVKSRAVSGSGISEVGSVVKNAALNSSDQKLLGRLQNVQANSKALKAQRIEAQSLVMMAQRGETHWQNKVVNFLSDLFGGKKPDPKKDEDKKIGVTRTEQQKSVQETSQGQHRQVEFTVSELKAIKHIKMTRDFTTFQKTGIISNKLEHMLRYSPRVLELMKNGTFELMTTELTALKHAKMFGSFTTYQNTGVISNTLKHALRNAPRVLERMEMRFIK